MDKMTEALISTMLGEETTIYSISYDMENASSDISGATVLGGKEFSAEISANKGCDNLSVTVKMGGKDITEEVYSDGKILIGKITGDIEISAKAIRPALDFRWEFDGTNLVSVGETENILKRLSGTTESGMQVSKEVPKPIRCPVQEDKICSKLRANSGRYRKAVFLSSGKKKA